MSLEKILVSVIAALFQSIAVTFVTFKQMPKCNNQRKVIFFILILLFCLASFYIIPNQLRFVLFVSYIALVIYFVLGVKDKKIIVYAFNTVILLSILEIIATSFLVLIRINSVDIVNNYMYNLLANILVSSFAILFINISFIKNLFYKILNLFDKNKKLLNYLYIFLLILYLIVSKNGLELILKSNYYVNILFMFSIVLVIVIIIRNEFKYDQINEQNKQMLGYVTKYEKIITEQGKANHEFKNQLMVIRGYAQMNSPRLIEYLDSITEDANKTHSSYLISQLNKFPDGGIKGLLYYKLSMMDDEKIKYDINVETGVKTNLKSLSISEYKNITKILGVLLDNAIDASKQTKSKRIIISVSKEKSKVIFSIYNTYSGKIDLSKIGTGHTTKGQGHGYGLRLVKDIVDANDMFSIGNFLEDEYYVSTLSIKIPKKKNKK